MVKMKCKQCAMETRLRLKRLMPPGSWSRTRSASLAGKCPLHIFMNPFVLFFTRLKLSNYLFISEESFACEICRKTFAYRQNMLKHRRRHTTNPARPPHGDGRARPVETSQCKKIAYGIFVVVFFCCNHTKCRPMLMSVMHQYRYILSLNSKA